MHRRDRIACSPPLLGSSIFTPFSESENISLLFFCTDNLTESHRNGRSGADCSPCESVTLAKSQGRHCPKAATQAKPGLNGALDFCALALLPCVVETPVMLAHGHQHILGSTPPCPWLTEAIQPTFNTPTFGSLPGSRQSNEVSHHTKSERSE